MALVGDIFYTMMVERILFFLNIVLPDRIHSPAKDGIEHWAVY
jgi:hypothetical protein